MGKETSVAVSMFGIALSKKMTRIDVTYEELVYMHGAFASAINQCREQYDNEPINYEDETEKVYKRLIEIVNEAMKKVTPPPQLTVGMGREIEAK